MQREELLSAHKARTIAISQLETQTSTPHVRLMFMKVTYINKVVDSKRSRVQMLSRL